MVWDSVLQIIGIALMATGAILTLSKLWQEYFKSERKRAEFQLWAYYKYLQADNEIKKFNKKNMKEIQDSDHSPEEYIKSLCEMVNDRKQTEKNKERMKKQILRKLTTDRYFLYTGVFLIIIGALIQIIGVVIQ